MSARGSSQSASNSPRMAAGGRWLPRRMQPRMSASTFRSLKAARLLPARSGHSPRPAACPRRVRKRPSRQGGFSNFKYLGVGAAPPRCELAGFNDDELWRAGVGSLCSEVFSEGMPDRSRCVGKSQGGDNAEGDSMGHAITEHGYTPPLEAGSGHLDCA